MHHSLSDMVLDICQNSIEAVSSLIVLDYRETGAILEVFVMDNGKGMDEETLKKALDPFYTDGVKHKNRKVGLGLPFLKQTVEAVGGKFQIESRKDEGTSVYMELPKDHIDLPEVGSLPGLFSQLQLFDGTYEFVVNRYLDNKRYTVTRSELRSALGDLNQAECISLANRYFESQEEAIHE